MDTLINLTKEQINEILTEIGSGEPIETAEEFAEFLCRETEENKIKPSDMKKISKHIHKIALEQGHDIRLNEIYNAAEVGKTKNTFISAIKKFFFKKSTKDKQESAEDSASETTPEVAEPLPEDNEPDNENIDSELTPEKAAGIKISDVENIFLTRLTEGGINADDIQTSTNNNYIPDFDIRYEDNIKIFNFNSKVYTTELAAIANSKNKIVSLGKLKRESGDTVRYVGINKFVSGNWGNNINFRLVLFKNGSVKFDNDGNLSDTALSVVNFDLRACELKKETMPLCVDFGTCNTTVGYAENGEPRIMYFSDVTKTPYKSVSMLPTIVYVEDCSDNKKIKYLFGYKAEKKVKNSGDSAPFEGKASVFYEIKRWITTENETIEIIDENSNSAEVTHYDIIKAYLDYVVNCADLYFKKHFTRLHFTAPVRLKYKLNEILRRAFKNTGREVLDANESIDEGIAIIYNKINRNIKNLATNSQKNDTTSDTYMIIDCGGGTTDVACCSYSLDKFKLTGADAVKLNIKVEYSGGDTNYGGNNITYRIMQLLKIKIAHEYALTNKINQTIISRLTELIDSDNILDKIDDSADKNIIDSLYGKLEAEYDKADLLIPTKFGCKGIFTEKSGDMKHVRRNFYYLWNLAEKIKVEFYKKESIVRMSSSSNGEDELNIFELLNDLDFCLYAAKDGKLTEYREKPDIALSVYDIANLIKAEIYSLLKAVLPADLDQKISSSTSSFLVKLSGQSCKIGLFQELLKEFIPGKMLRGDNGIISDHNGDDAESKKLGCVKGAIMYVNDKENGIQVPNITNEVNTILYTVSKLGAASEVILSNNGSVAVLNPKAANEMKLLIKPESGVNENEQIYVIRFNESAHDNDDDLYSLLLKESRCADDEKYLNDIKSAIANLDGAEDEMNIFIAVPTRDNASFICILLEKKVNNGEDVLKILSKVTVPFETNLSSVRFFDGKR